jgi:hypothetical protein
MKRFRQFVIASVVAVVGLGGVVAGTASPAGASPAPRVGAVAVTASGPAMRVFGSDGKEHLEYDLIFTSVFSSPVTVTSIKVMSGAGRRLLYLQGDALVSATHPLLGGLDAPTSTIPVSGALATEIDVAVSPKAVPSRLTHRITYEVPPDAPRTAILGSREISGPKVPLDPREPIVIASPLRGAGWANLNGCCTESAHRYLRLAVNGRIVKPEMFAIDWIRVQDQRIAEGDGNDNREFYGEGAPVHAVADGTIVAVHDGLEETAPFGQPELHETADYGGNSVTQRIAPGVYAYYAHFQPGSIAVEVGDRVRTGTVLGRLGSSGNSTAPHLHFQLQDGLGVVASNSLPFEIDRFTLSGSIVDAGTFPELEVQRANEPLRDAHPLDGTIADFRPGDVD